eukprot:m.396627 g.396627  ORF g.396627 m.396627 type:complete len:68 (+) comp56413_c0_seq7:389-592(+)
MHARSLQSPHSCLPTSPGSRAQTAIACPTQESDQTNNPKPSNMSISLRCVSALQSIFDVAEREEFIN